MKYKIDISLIFALAGGLLFNYLFWKEELALNLFLLSLFILTIYGFSKNILSNKKLLGIAVAHVSAGLLVLINHSILTIIAWYISLFVLVGYTHFPELRSIFTALTAALLQFFTAPIGLIKKIAAIEIAGFTLKPVLKLAKYLVIPGFIVLVFSIIYSIANPVFESYIGTFFENIAEFIAHIFTFFFKDISIDRIAFLVVGILFSAFLFITFKNELEKRERNFQDKLLRVRINKNEFSIWREIIIFFSGDLLKKKMALKTENAIAIISFTGLNILLLFLNGIDISTLWMGNLGSLNFSQALHGSANALIMSIAMAMLVILYFFNGNLNFYSKNKTIRFLAYGWIIQNSFLILSVLLRDYHYIDMHGLTYKRIGVIVFSLLCMIGLFIVYLKVAKQQSLFYLFKMNGAIWYLLLLVSGTINWDVFIVNYNIEKRNTATLDVRYLMTLSDKTLPTLIENKEILKKYLSPSTSPYSIDGAATKTIIIDSIKINKQIKHSLSETFEVDLAKRTENFKTNQEKISWLSWNYRDWETSRYFKK